MDTQNASKTVADMGWNSIITANFWHRYKRTADDLLILNALFNLAKNDLGTLSHKGPIALTTESKSSTRTG